MLFVRPLLTYACTCWFNSSASAIEKLRLFERKCLRVCLNINRKKEDNYKKFYSNKILYNKANIPRIDNFIIKLVRNHYAAAKNITDNQIITNISNLFDNDEFEKCKKTGYVPPQAFLNLDKSGYIKNQYNVPILYHWRRNKANKKIEFDANNVKIINDNKVYSDVIPKIDSFSFIRLNKDKIWWLEEKDKYIKELNERYKKYNRPKNYLYQ